MLFNITTFTLIHVIISLIGLFAGCVVAGGFMSGRRLDRWTGTFLTTTALTSITGFGFPFDKLLPGHYAGFVSLVIIGLVLFARYGRRLVAPWMNVYVIGSITALYFNALVLVDQLFRRVPALIAAAPTQKEVPYAITQLIVLALFVWLGRAAVQGMRTAPATQSAAAGGRWGA